MSYRQMIERLFPTIFGDPTGPQGTAIRLDCGTDVSPHTDSVLEAIPNFNKGVAVVLCRRTSPPLECSAPIPSAAICDCEVPNRHVLTTAHTPLQADNLVMK